MTIVQFFVAFNFHTHVRSMFYLDFKVISTFLFNFLSEFLLRKLIHLKQTLF